METSSCCRTKRYHPHHQQHYDNIIELCNLSEELIEQILCRVPIKSRTRLKSVSKNWHNFIDRLRLSIPLTTSAGLLISIPQNPNLYSSDFIRIEDPLTPNPKATLFSSLLHNYRWLLDSCNGLLLYATSDANLWTYHISSPFISDPIALPPAHKVSRSCLSSLISDGSSSFDGFRVICVFIDEVDFGAKSIKYMVFESMDWEWRENEARIVNSELMGEDGFVRGHFFRPSVYCKGKVYWIWSTCLLIYDDEIEFFKLVRLPSCEKIDKNNVYLYQLLWEAEGLVHFISPVNEGFKVWAYLEDDDDDKERYSMWKLKQVVRLDRLISGKFEVLCTVKTEMNKSKMWWSKKRIQPVAFNEDLQLLYLHMMPGVIVAYSFETQKSERVWSFGEAGSNLCMSKIFPFLFNSRY